MHVIASRDIPEDHRVIADWNNLVSRMECPEVFFTHQWALAASRAFSSIIRPLIFLVYDSDRLCGVAALATNRASPQTAFFLAASTADYCDVVSDPETRGTVLAVVLDELRKSGVCDLELANLPSDSSTLRQLPRVARSSGFHLNSRVAYDCGVVHLGSAQERQALLQSVARKDREKRGLKKLAQLGPVRLTHLSSDQCEGGLDPIISAHVSRFLATERVSPLVRPERRLFLMQLVRQLAQAGWLKISQLELDGQPIAWNFGFRFSDSWFWYLPTFQTEYEHLSPGSCLLRLLVEEGCADQSVGRLDLGLGDEAYKERFANTVRRTYYVQLSQSLVQHSANVGRQLLTEGAHQLPRMEEHLRRTRARACDLGSRIRSTGLTATAGHALRRTINLLASSEEVLLFEAPQIEAPTNADVTLEPLGWKQLAEAAINNAEDVQTLTYLMRSAKRLRQAGASGFLLRDQEAQPAHFLWIENCDGFHLAEIDHQLEFSYPGAAMIFDCWTPAANRGRGYYATAICLAAARLQREQKRAWIFSAASNASSVRGILKAGFIYRFSLLRRTRWGRSTLTRSDTAGVVR